MDKGTGMSRQIKPWNVDCLQAFKQEYNVDHLSALIIDGISMAKHWMLTYLDECLKEDHVCVTLSGGRTMKCIHRGLPEGGHTGPLSYVLLPDSLTKLLLANGCGVASTMVVPDV